MSIHYIPKFTYDTIKDADEMTFIVKDYYYVHNGETDTPTTVEVNGSQLRSTLYDLFPQADDEVYDMLDFIAHIAVYGTTEQHEYDAYKCMTATLHISVSELI